METRARGKNITTQIWCLISSSKNWHRRVLFLRTAMPWVTWMTSSRRAYIISGYWNSARVRAAVLEFADERAKQNAQSDGTRVPCKRVVRRMSTRVKPHLAVTTTKSACFRLRRNLMKKAAKVGRTTLPREHSYSLVLAAFLFSSLSLSVSSMPVVKRAPQPCIRYLHGSHTNHFITPSCLFAATTFLIRDPWPAILVKRENTTRHI